MAKIGFRQSAIIDLNGIWRYTSANWSESQADKYYSKIKAACRKISSNSEIGKPYDSISSGLRGIKSEKHIIFYTILANGQIEIIRILHERMDLSNHLKNEE